MVVMKDWDRQQRVAQELGLKLTGSWECSALGIKGQTDIILGQGDPFFKEKILNFHTVEAQLATIFSNYMLNCNGTKYRLC